MNYKDYIAIIEDFPVKGISFKDITPLMKNGDVFKKACEELTNYAKKVGATVIVGPESRGFIFGCPVATNLGIGFVPIRKPGKLPRKVVTKSYDLEYGSNEIQMHSDSIQPGQNVLIVDDLLATGGTVAATVKLVERLGGKVIGIAFLIELEALKGRDRLQGYNVYSLLKY